MSNVNYAKDGVLVNTEHDGIIIRKHIADLVGGRALDITGYPASVIPCGLPIITNGNGTYKPLAPADVTTGTGDDAVTTYCFTLPTDYSYAGICGATEVAGKGVSVLTAAVVNEGAMLNHITDMFPSGMESPNTLSLSAIKTALPHLIFQASEAADA